MEVKQTKIRSQFLQIMNRGQAFRKQRFGDGNCMCMEVYIMESNLKGHVTWLSKVESNQWIMVLMSNGGLIRKFYFIIGIGIKLNWDN